MTGTRSAPEPVNVEDLREIAESIVDVRTQEGKILLAAADEIEWLRTELREARMVRARRSFRVLRRYVEAHRGN